MMVWHVVSSCVSLHLGLCSRLVIDLLIRKHGLNTCHLVCMSAGVMCYAMWSCLMPSLVLYLPSFSVSGDATEVDCKST